MTFVVDGPPWFAMGVGRALASEWLIEDELRDEQRALKRRLLTDHRDDVLAFAPGLDSTPACAELLRMLDENQRYSARFSPEFAHDFSPEFGREALERAALVVQEDLCVLLPDADGPLVLAAGCVCFPSHWRLRDKIGQPAAAIHGAVPGYDRELGAKVDTFLDRLRPETVMKRRNWTIHESPELFAPEPPAVSDPSIPPEQLWLRSERQTLRRLPETGAVVFTIRTQQTCIASLEHRPAVASALADRLEAQPHDIARYAGYSVHVPDLVRRLHAWGRSERRERNGRE